MNIKFGRNWARPTRGDVENINVYMCLTLCEAPRATSPYFVQLSMPLSLVKICPELLEEMSKMWNVNDERRNDNGRSSIGKAHLSRWLMWTKTKWKQLLCVWSLLYNLSDTVQETSACQLFLEHLT